jgi:hypothetical protein
MPLTLFIGVEDCWRGSMLDIGQAGQPAVGGDEA